MSLVGQGRKSEVSLWWTGWKVRGESVGGESGLSLGGSQR